MNFQTGIWPSALIYNFISVSLYLRTMSFVLAEGTYRVCSIESIWFIQRKAKCDFFEQTEFDS